MKYTIVITLLLISQLAFSQIRIIEKDSYKRGWMELIDDNGTVLIKKLVRSEDGGQEMNQEKKKIKLNRNDELMLKYADKEKSVKKGMSIFLYEKKYFKNEK